MFLISGRCKDYALEGDLYDSDVVPKDNFCPFSISQVSLQHFYLSHLSTFGNFAYQKWGFGLMNVILDQLQPDQKEKVERF
jgi:hypothetical protein